MTKVLQIYNSSTNALKKTNTYGYDTTWKDKLTLYNGETIAYDGIGNPLKYRNGMSFTWKNGRWLSTTTLSEETKITYRYNANGMRTQKQVGSKVTNYYYDSNNNLIAERTDNATYEKYEMHLPYWVVSRRVYDFLIKRYPRMNFEPIFLMNSSLKDIF